MDLHEKRFARCALGFALTAAGLLVCSAATAQPAQSQPQAWYGWQILVVDLAGAAMAAGGVASGSNPGTSASNWAGPLEVTGTVFYFAGGPAVHLAHEHVGRAAISFGLRVGAPLVLGLASAGIASALYQPYHCDPQKQSEPCDNTNWGGLAAALIGTAGAGVGVLSASVIDIAVLARGPASNEPAKPSGHSARLWPSLIVLPRVTTVRDAGRRLVPMLGISGPF
jgi:hypothetical protein